MLFLGAVYGVFFYTAYMEPGKKAYGFNRGMN
jgi:hypothetical protein